MSEKEEESFKVVDKRRFNMEGDTDSPKKESEVIKETVHEGVNAKEYSKAEEDKINFSSFILGMYTHTLIFIGDMPHPETKEVQINLEAARQNIDILNVLEEKTKGNLSPEEQNLMKEVLDMLRVQYVSKIKK